MTDEVMDESNFEFVKALRTDVDEVICAHFRILQFKGIGYHDRCEIIIHALACCISNAIANMVDKESYKDVLDSVSESIEKLLEKCIELDNHKEDEQNGPEIL